MLKLLRNDQVSCYEQSTNYFIIISWTTHMDSVTYGNIQLTCPSQTQAFTVIQVQCKQVYSYGTFELRIRSKFYCSNDVIVGHVSLTLYRETVKSMFVSCLLYIVLSPGVCCFFYLLLKHRSLHINNKTTILQCIYQACINKSKLQKVSNIKVQFAILICFYIY